MYATFEEANAQTLNFPNALQRMFHSMEMALAFMDANNTRPPPAPQLFYAVAWGRNPAVYASHQQANEQTLGFHDSMQRRCNTMEEALAFIADNRDPEPDAHPLFVVDRNRHNDDNMNN